MSTAFGNDILTEPKLANIDSWNAESYSREQTLHSVKKRYFVNVVSSTTVIYTVSTLETYCTCNLSKQSTRSTFEMIFLV